MRPTEPARAVDAAADAPERLLELYADAPELTPSADLAAQQALLERAGAARGRDRFLERLSALEARGMASVGALGRRRILAEFDGLVAALKRAQAERRGTAGKRAAVDQRFAALDAEMAAYLTLRIAVDAAGRRDPLGRAALSLGGAVEDELACRAAKADDPSLLRALAVAASRARSSDEKRGVIARGLATARPALGEAWSGRERKLLGLGLIDVALAALPLFTLELDQGDAHRLCFSDAMEADRARLGAWAAAALPEREPMITPPRDWTGAFGGGWLTRDEPLIKAGRPEQLASLDAAAPDIVYAAVNAAQKTAWRVHPRLFELMATLEAEGEALGGLPAHKPATKPAREEHQRFWRAGERARRSRRSAHERMLRLARRFRRFERLYMPHAADFRGRLYALPLLNPQGPDPMRALLEFADAKPVGSEGWKWLAIHLANCGDFGKISKAPLAARAEWTLAHEERIRAVAADPRADTWWTEADKPWQFLAACFEWVGFLEEGETFRSRLPVALDGTCSGIQHFALALRDEATAEAVNLTPSATSQDIYERVAAETRARLTRDAEAAETAEARALAAAWLAFGVDRGVAKRPTMTYGYGSRVYGYTDQILADVLRPAREAGLEPWPFGAVKDGAAARFLAERLMASVETVVRGAAQAMAWLQEVVALANADGVALEWTAPDGFPIRQAYPKERAKRVATTVAGALMRFNLREEVAGFDPRRQRQGVAPNFVHALDACHLRLTVARAGEEGFSSFQLVHDSFGVHAADTPRFFQLIRETLIEIYDAVDVLARFRDEIAGQLSERTRAKLPAPPAAGGLDLAGLLDSEFCFS